MVSMAIEHRPVGMQDRVYLWLRLHPGWHAASLIARYFNTPGLRRNILRALDALYAKRLVDRRPGRDDSRWRRRIVEFCYIDPPVGLAAPIALRRTCRECGERSRNIARHYQYNHPGKEFDHDQ